MRHKRRADKYKRRNKRIQRGIEKKRKKGKRIRI